MFSSLMRAAGVLSGRSMLLCCYAGGQRKTTALVAKREIGTVGFRMNEIVQKSEKGRAHA